MTKNPFYNAIAASAYIAVVVTIMNFADKANTTSNPFIAGLLMISLFTLSAAVMGYLFVYQPVRMYIDGEKERGIKLFLQTLGVFAGITVIILVTYLLGIIR